MNQSYLERNIELYRIDLTNSIDDAIYNDKIILSEIVSKFFSEKKFDESNPKEGFKVGKEKTYWISYTSIAILDSGINFIKICCFSKSPSSNSFLLTGVLSSILTIETRLL